VRVRRRRLRLGRPLATPRAVLDGVTERRLVARMSAATSGEQCVSVAGDTAHTRTATIFRRFKQREETCARILAGRSPRGMPEQLSLCEGRREGRVKASPMARQQTRKAGGSHHRFSRIIRHSLRDGFNAVLRALPRDRAFLPLSRADRSAHLASASGGQDQTTSTSAHALLVWRCVRVHRIPPHVR
jgi:hypothetical protein